MSFKYFIILLSILGSANASRILGIFPIAAQSHLFCNTGIMDSLHAAGHHITMIRPFPIEAKLENFTTINSRSNNTYVFIGISSVYDFEVGFENFMDILLEKEMINCHDVLSLPVIQEALNSTRKLYDVMFVELMASYECFLPIAEKLDIPVIGVVTFHSWKLADRNIGLPNNPAIIPFELTSAKPEMTFVERIENLLNNIFIDNFWRFRMKKETAKVYPKYFTEDILYKKDMSLIFYNNHDSLLPRPMPANAINIGGIHLRPAKPLPKDLLKFIDEATHGVILFTFGSVINASTLSIEQRNAFLEAFALIPQRVIWKFEQKTENVPKNVLLRHWIPQRDILEHKNVIAFMSHCGQSGVYEAVVTGTPVVTMPLFADQFSNAGLLLHRQVAVPLDYKTVTKDKVLTAVNTIINDTSYFQRMQELSHAFKDRPMSPQESIVYWTEYVIRHNGAPFLKALGTDMPLYKYLMLDIIACFAVIIIVSLFLTLTIIRRLFTLFKKKPKYLSSVKKDK